MSSMAGVGLEPRIPASLADSPRLGLPERDSPGSSSRPSRSRGVSCAAAARHLGEGAVSHPVPTAVEDSRKRRSQVAPALVGQLIAALDRAAVESVAMALRAASSLTVPLHTAVFSLFSIESLLAADAHSQELCTDAPRTSAVRCRCQPSQTPQRVHRLGWSAGDAATRPAPRPAITADKPRIGHKDHDPRLEH